MSHDNRFGRSPAAYEEMGAPMRFDENNQPYREQPGDLHVADADLLAVLRGERYLLLDGAMGTMLQRAGLKAGELPELLCLERPDTITSVHRAYVEAGSEMVTTNTFGANAAKLGGAACVEEVFAAAVACARAAGPRWVAADIGPTGALLRPLGTLAFDDAYGLFAEQARAAEASGADVILIETMADLLEAKAAVLAAKECTRLPIFATMTFGEDGRTFLGTSPEIAAITLAGLGADVVGINCSLGPAEVAPFARRMADISSVPVLVQANAGLPRDEGGRTVYDVAPGPYAEAVSGMLDAGVSAVGGCCGTDPSYIGRLSGLLAGRSPRARSPRPCFAVTSAQRAVVLPQGSRDVACVGERINPTGKPRLKEALRTGDMDYLVGQAIAQAEQGADLLDINLGLPEVDEPALFPRAVEALQGACPLPLMIDSSDPAAVEAGVRAYAGKPIVNSVNAKDESLEAVLPIVRHYGCAVVGLTLDENGIPPTAEGRFACAKKIVRAAERAGIPRDDVAIDCLVMTASTNQEQVVEILRAVSMVKARLGVRCVLGVSNVSFGLPQRPLLNAAFLTAAFAAGLDLPIMNPGAPRYRDALAAWRVLNAQDAGAAAFIERYATWRDPYDAPADGQRREGAAGAAGQEGAAGQAGASALAAAPGRPADEKRGEGLGAPGKGGLAGDGSRCPADDPYGVRHLVISGRRGDVAPAVAAALDQAADPLDVMNGLLVPALDEVGERFEAGTFFLPQLMAAAEAARVGFDLVKERLASTRAADGPDAGAVASKGAVCLATVAGDIHDIGKNIVKMLLENYGYTIYDLGRDVAPEAVLACVREHGVPVVGLSALMTTTVPAMRSTIELLRREAPGVKVMVGGAVLTEDYAAQIGADAYAKDAAASAKIAERFFAELGR